MEDVLWIIALIVEGSCKMQIDEERDFLLAQLENLEEENRRLREKNKNTIKFKMVYNEHIYELDTQIEKPLKEMKDYYLADDNINPTKVHLIDYSVSGGINRVLIMCDCRNERTGEIEYYSPKNLYKTKSEASDSYLNKKHGRKEKQGK